MYSCCPCFFSKAEKKQKIFLQLAETLEQLARPSTKLFYATILTDNNPLIFKIENMPNPQKIIKACKSAGITITPKTSLTETISLIETQLNQILDELKSTLPPQDFNAFVAHDVLKNKSLLNLDKISPDEIFRNTMV